MYSTLPKLFSALRAAVGGGWWVVGVRVATATTNNQIRIFSPAARNYQNILVVDQLQFFVVDQLPKTELVVHRNKLCTGVVCPYLLSFFRQHNMQQCRLK